MKLKLVVLALSIVMLLALGSSYTSGYGKEKDGVQLTYEIEGVGDAQYTPQCISQCMLPLRVTYTESASSTGNIPESYMLFDILKTYFTKERLDDIAISSIKILKWKEVTDARVDMSQKGECDPAYIDFSKLTKEKHYDIEYDDTETGEHKNCAVDNVNVLYTHSVPEWVKVDDNTQIYKGQTFNILVEGRRTVSLGYKSSDIVLEIAGMNTTEYAWWDSNWLYYQPINVSAAAVSKKGYAVNVLLNSANVGTHWVWATDCNGVRFVDAGDNELDYYRENCSASSASFWVEVKDNITTAGNEIRMFYGNTIAATTSNGTRTFLAFDDFEDNSVSDWTASGGTALAINASSGVAGDYCMQVTHSGSYQGGGIKDVKNFAAAGENDSVQIHYLAYPETAGTKEMGYYVGSSEVAYSGAGLFMDNGGATGWWTANGNQLTGSLSAKWYIIRELVDFVAKTFTVYIDGALEVSNEGLRDSGSITKLNRLNKLDGESGAIYYLDNEWVSKYQAQEPVYAIGSEVAYGVTGAINIKSPHTLPYVYHNGSIWFNATTSSNASWCYVELYSHNFTMTNSTGKWHYFNATIMSGIRTARFWCNISGSVVSNSRNITLNYPYAHLQSPSNTTYFSKSVSFNITYNTIVSTVAVELLGHNFSLVNSTGKWWYRNASMVNGVHKAVFWANDSLGNVNKTSIYFTVNAFAEVKWWDSDWLYNQQIIVHAPKTTKRGYVVNVLLDSANVGGNWNWSSDCNGVRFIDVNNSQLDYYRENCSASYASFWVKVNENITSSGSLIRMFYGNPAVSSTSNGTRTFLAFDDFEDGNVSDWTASDGTALAANVSNGVSGDYCLQVTLSSAYGGGGIKDVNNFVASGENDTVQIHFLAYPQTAGNKEMGYYVGSSEVAYSGAQLYMDNGGLTGWWGGDPAAQLTFSLSNKWYIIKELINFTENNHTVFIDGVRLLKGGAIRSKASISKFNRFKLDGDNGAIFYIDNIWISKYQAQEPAYMMGSESSLSGITVQSPLASPYAYHNSSVWFNATTANAASWCYVELNSHNFTMTNSTGKWHYFNASILSGSRTAKFWCNVSGIVVSSSRNFTLNYPYAHLQSPSNTTYHVSKLDFNVTYSSLVVDSAIELRGHNFSLVNSTGKWWYRNASMSEGNFKVVFWANDTMGNVNKTILYFSISFPPKIVVVSPLNNTSNLSTIFKINCTDAIDSSLTAKVYVNFTHLFRSSFLWVRTEPPSYGAYYATTKNLTNWTFNSVGEQTGEFHLVLMPYANQINNHTMIVVIRGQTNQKYVVSLDNGTTWSDYRILPNSGTPNTTYGLSSIAMMNNSRGVMMNWIPTNEGGGIEVTNITFNGTDLTKTHWKTFDSPRKVAATPSFSAGFIERINDTWAIMMFQEVMVTGQKIHLMSRLFNMKTGSLGNLYNISTIEAESPFIDYAVGRVHIMGDNGNVYLFSHSRCPSGCGYGETQWKVMRHITNASSNYQSWSRDIAINGDPDEYFDYLGGFDVDENGNFYFIIGNITSDLGWEDEELWLMTSSDKGRSFQRQNVIRRSGSYPSFAMGGEAEQHFFNLTFGKGWSMQNMSIIAGNTVTSLTPNAQLELGKFYKWYAVCTDSQGNSVSSGNYTFYYGTPPVTLSIGSISVPSTVDPIENSTVNVNAIVNVTGQNFDTGICKLYYPNNTIKEQSLAAETIINSTLTKLNCTLTLKYHNTNGTYNVTIIANNTGSIYDQSDTTFIYNLLVAFQLNTSALDFGTLYIGQNSTKTFTSSNTGNQNLNLQLNGSNLVGASHIIGVSNMTFDDDSDLSDGTTMTTSFQTFTSLPVSAAKTGYINLKIPQLTPAEVYTGNIIVRSI